MPEEGIVLRISVYSDFVDGFKLFSELTDCLKLNKLTGDIFDVFYEILYDLTTFYSVVILFIGQKKHNAISFKRSAGWQEATR